VDPVATLAIFHQLDVNYTLHMLVFGESVLNDAASLVLYQTLEAFEETSATVGSIFANIGIFVLILIGSMLTGAVCGVLSALFFKKIDVNNFPSLEMSIYFVMSYIPYLIAESSGMSGIIALLFYGIVCSHYTFFCISPTSQFSTPHMFRMLAYIAETMIFLYLGVAAFVYPQDFSILFTVSALFWCLVGRALNIFPLCFITNVFHAGEISWKNQVIMWFSGLRGGIAFVLSLRFPIDVGVIVTSTLMIVLLSICLLGAGTMPALRLLKVDTAQTAESLIALSKNRSIESTKVHRKLGFVIRLQNRWVELDKRDSYSIGFDVYIRDRTCRWCKFPIFLDNASMRFGI